ncbi:MAG: hypothetical protein JO060_08030, partial [Candidatus Eremiobacteraeota bacterium]|nr:hypothetical protein [Candidatus Eremiobacteraeota bacterium]
PVDDLDHSDGSFAALGHKIGIDATRKSAAEGYTRTWPPDIVMDFDTRTLVSRRWDEYGLADSVPQEDRWSGQGLAALERLLREPAYTPGSVDASALHATELPRANR